MGVAAAIGATLLGGFISGRAQQQQYNAAAQQAEVNAQIANQNADKLQAQAEEQQSQNANMANKKHANVGDTVIDDTPEGMSETVLASEAAQDDRFKLQKKQLIGG